MQQLQKLVEDKCGNKLLLIKCAKINKKQVNKDKDSWVSQIREKCLRDGIWLWYANTNWDKTQLRPKKIEKKKKCI